MADATEIARVNPLRCQRRRRKEPIMQEAITYVGIDAHKKNLAIAMLVGHERTPTTWTVANEPRAVERLRRKLTRLAPGPIECCYEAGPCGYALYRQLHLGRLRCHVIAPALIPRNPGDRIKTDRRDARKLAELHRAGVLTDVRPPTPREEAVRDLARARDDARDDLQRGRQRLGKFLLRRGLHYAGKNWTRGHRAWVAWPCAGEWHPAFRHAPAHGPGACSCSAASARPVARVPRSRAGSYLCGPCVNRGAQAGGVRPLPPPATRRFRGAARLYAVPRRTRRRGAAGLTVWGRRRAGAGCAR